MRRSAVFSILVLLAAPTLSARDREAARKAYGKASEYHAWLQDLPASRRSRDRFNRAIYLFRTVVDHDPTYGAADDALFAVAALYEEMADRFSSDTYKRRAIYYFDFVAREYPTTPHRKDALSRAQRLRAPPPPPVAREAASAGDLATLSEVRYWSNEDYTRVVLQLDREVQFSKEVLRGPDRIYFDLASTRLEKSMEREYEVNGLFIKQVRVAQNRMDQVRVVLDFEQINNHRVFALYDPYRIVIDTRGQASSGGADTMKTAAAVISLEEEASENRAPSSIPSPTRGGDLTMTRVLGLKVGRVVIDPGHGGHDTGTIGPNGLKEKDLVLDVALRLQELLASRLKTEVILTRDKDRFIPLEERTAIANKNGADLFISIHANSSRSRQVSGVETYVLSFATSQAEREVALRENAGAGRSVAELEDLIRQIARDDYNQESIDLATVVQQQLHTSLKSVLPNQRNRGVKRAPFVVLLGSNMPSILSEIGFISNPKDAESFSRDETREQVAEALFQGLSEYLKSLGSLPVAEKAVSGDSSSNN